MSRGVTRRDVMRLIRLIDGSLDTRASAKLRRRLAADPDLARAHRRLVETRNTLNAISKSEAPELPFRQIAAQIRWRTAHQTDALSPTDAAVPRTQRPVALRPVLALTVAAVMGGICSLAAYQIAAIIAGADGLADRPNRPATRQERKSGTHLLEIAALPTLLQGQVTVAAQDNQPTDMAPNRPLLAGDRIVTGRDSALVLQWGRETGIALDAQTEVDLRRFDTHRQTLALRRGRIVALVAPTAPFRQLAVLAGPVRVQVTGTHFAVTRANGSASVEVFRGAVRLLDEDGSSGLPRDGLLLQSGSRLQFDQLGRSSHPHPEPLEDVQPPRLHLQPWASFFRTLTESGLLTIESRPSGATLSLDAIEVGQTNLTVRSSAGRHLVELRRNGKLLRREWIDFRASGSDRLTVAPRPPRRASRPALPPGILETFHARAREIRRCYERALKRNPALEGEIVLQLEIDGEGRVGSAKLNKDSVGDPAVGRCALIAIRSWTFPPNAAVDVVYPFVFRPAFPPGK